MSSHCKCLSKKPSLSFDFSTTTTPIVVAAIRLSKYHYPKLDLVNVVSRQQQCTEVILKMEFGEGRVKVVERLFSDSICGQEKNDNNTNRQSMMDK